MSDIHANMAALDAVMDNAGRMGGFDRCWVLGDTVGYGPQPNECLERVAALEAVAVAGNHEAAAVGRIPLSDFNAFAAAAAMWTADQLTERSIRYINSLPLVVSDEDFTLVHGSPRDPVWEYMVSTGQARASLQHFSTTGCVTGHTHVPAVMLLNSENGEMVSPMPGAVVPLDSERFYVNPGSVGQPRDSDPRAAYAIIDTARGTAEFRRVPYDIAATQSLMAKAGLPGPLISRLERGR